jgi:hypothetical protein
MTASDVEQPYLTVDVDDRGSVCWVVVGGGQRVECASGVRALAVLEAMCRSGGGVVP